MRLKSTVVALACGVVALNMAVSAFSKAKIKPQGPAPVMQQVKVNLYAEPVTTSRVLETFRPNQTVVPIFRKGEWVKVGSPQDGKVGWVNTKQYRQAYDAWYQPRMQIIFVRSESDKNGKSTVNVVAYSNGEKLDEKQARALYKRMRKEQRHEMQSMHNLNRQMNRYFVREDQLFARDFPGFRHAGFVPSVMMRPLIVVSQPTKSASLIKTGEKHPVAAKK